MKHEKLSKADISKLWGEDTPYSQVNLIEQTRVLGDGISRIFLVVEAEINPFTFEYALMNKSLFKKEPAIQQLLENAEYRGPSEGYRICVGEEELIDKQSFEVAFSYRKVALENILKMHELVIKDFDLKRSKNKGLKIQDLNRQADKDRKYIWNEASGQVIPVDDDIWESESVIHSSAGEKNGKIRYYFVLALSVGDSLKEMDIKSLVLHIKVAERRYGVEIEGADGGRGYMMFTVLIGPGVVPADFVETCIRESNIKSRLFREDYYITNLGRPTGNEIIGFLKSLK